MERPSGENSQNCQNVFKIDDCASETNAKNWACFGETISNAMECYLFCCPAIVRSQERRHQNLRGTELGLLNCFGMESGMFPCS